MNDAIPVALAALLGALIGAEREWRRHSGGLRSASLVSAAACVFARLALAYGGASPAAALGAIATGVGFLGAGVIMRHGSQVRGLSTAATFWSLAAIGAGCGVEAYVLSASLAGIVLLAHVVLRPLSAWIEEKAPPEDRGPR